MDLYLQGYILMAFCLAIGIGVVIYALRGAQAKAKINWVEFGAISAAAAIFFFVYLATGSMLLACIVLFLAIPFISHSMKKNCPFCRKLIRRDAKVCYRCHRDLSPAALSRMAD
jgi:hypothetical protein